MSRIVPLDHATAQGHARELLDVVKSSLGVTPNMTTTMARSTVLDGWLGFDRALRKGSINAATGERIALGVAEVNGCSYCLSAHSYLGANVAKLDADELERARHFASADQRAAAILAFAEAVLRTTGAVSDSDFEAAREAGLTDAELADAVGHVAINVTNLFNRAFEVEVDFPVVEPHQRATAG